MTKIAFVLLQNLLNILFCQVAQLFLKIRPGGPLERFELLRIKQIRSQWDSFAKQVQENSPLLKEPRFELARLLFRRKWGNETARPSLYKCFS